MTLSESRSIELDLWAKLGLLNERFGVVLQEFQNLPPDLISPTAQTNGDVQPKLGRLVATIIEQLAELEVKFDQSRTVTPGSAVKKKTNKSKKRPVEKRVTKGRRIRYVPIPKLANFHPAAPETVPWTHERRNELFKSVFQY